LIIIGTFVIVVTFGTPVLHFGTCESMFNTLGIISSEFWYIWFTLAHFTFGTPVGTLSVMVVILLVPKQLFGTLESFLFILDTIGIQSTLITFSTFHFGTLRVGSVFSILGVIPVSFGRFGALWYA